MLSQRQCLVLMEQLEKKTGYIYPIKAPSMGNAGDFYRLSMTTVLPPELFYFLLFELQITNPTFTQFKLASIIQQLKNKKADVKAVIDNKKSVSDENIRLMDNRYKRLEQKLTILESFYPEFLRDQNIVIDNTACCSVIDKLQEGIAIKGSIISNEKDVRSLFLDCQIISKYVIELTKRVLRELGVDMSLIITNTGKELSDIDIDKHFDFLNIRFKRMVSIKTT